MGGESSKKSKKGSAAHLAKILNETGTELNGNDVHHLGKDVAKHMQNASQSASGSKKSSHKNDAGKNVHHNAGDSGEVRHTQPTYAQAVKNGHQGNVPTRANVVDNDDDEYTEPAQTPVMAMMDEATNAAILEIAAEINKIMEKDTYSEEKDGPEIASKFHQILEIIEKSEPGTA